ncbi:transposase [Clostridium aceticum]|uniref:transposase n=1 Tax=Clostridium aceticum TaxID=84022 RepID=UPI001FA7BC97|nr:transposase [Clostridium aceticum]
MRGDDNAKEDKKRLLKTLLRYKEKCKYKIYAYCVMDNHLHLLLKEKEEPLEQIMRRIGGNFTEDNLIFS